MDVPPLTRPKAVLFDWDNTLVDSWEVIHEAMNTTLAAMGHAPWRFEDTLVRVRRSMREAFPELFGDRWQEARTVFYDRFRQVHLERLRTVAGADDLVKVLAGKGIYLGVVSNKLGEHLRAEVAYLGWERYFGRIIGAGDAPRDKPAVDAVDLALEGTGIFRDHHVWFIGDTNIDMQCAHEAGCRPILVQESPPDPAEFGEFTFLLHFRSCSALKLLVESL